MIELYMMTEKEKEKGMIVYQSDFRANQACVSG